MTFTLDPAGPGRTRLRMRQAGFDGLGAQLTRRILAGGWPGILRRLAARLGGPGGAGEAPPAAPARATGTST